MIAITHVCRRAGAARAQRRQGRRHLPGSATLAGARIARLSGTRPKTLRLMLAGARCTAQPDAAGRRGNRCGGRTPANPPGEGLITDVPLTIDPFIPTIVSAAAPGFADFITVGEQVWHGNSPCQEFTMALAIGACFSGDTCSALDCSGNEVECRRPVTTSMYCQLR